jgi:N-hydroxyarylamine O-acetyltransferase
MDHRTYLDRINYSGERHPSPATLSALQQAHLLAVPFENLDIHGGKRIVLDLPLLYRKIVEMNRGGFCYELNGLFHWLLRELGFRARLAMGRVYDRTTGVFGPDFDHMLILVEIDRTVWITDVGFGDFSMHPLKFVEDRPLKDENGVFQVQQSGGGFFTVSRFSPGEDRYLPEYMFSPIERQLSDFSPMCLYHQTSPHSHFTRTRVCSIATPTGRITLTDDRLIVTRDGVRTETPIGDEVEFARVVEEHFHISP